MTGEKRPKNDAADRVSDRQEETGNVLTLAEDCQPHRHVDEDPREAKKLDEVVHKQVNSFLADKP